MEVIRATNVNDAFTQGTQYMRYSAYKEESRVGSVMVSPTPVTTSYSHPKERVLLNSVRDANPFFHLFECLWMLDGSDDATWLDRFVHDFSSRFAESNGAQWGAYGERWRGHFGFDQLNEVVYLLNKDNNDRRVVIQMWDPKQDLNADVRDVPCNTTIYPRIVRGKLDITVCCRSNDMVWGAYGSNAVHFSFLQEYLAGRIGVDVGNYYQISNNFHIYDFAQPKLDGYQEEIAYPGTVPIGDHWEYWDNDLSKFMTDPQGSTYMNKWFLTTALPMWEAHRYYKEKRYDLALQSAGSILAPDWNQASIMWLTRRIK